MWRWASISLAAYLALSLAVVARGSLSLTRVAALNPFITWSFAAGGLVTLALQGLNVAGVIFEQELGPYFLGLLYLLVLAGVSFARMLPIGRPFESE